jgi:hypothetical protein
LNIHLPVDDVPKEFSILLIHAIFGCKEEVLQRLLDKSGGFQFLLEGR